MIKPCLRCYKWYKSISKSQMRLNVIQKPRGMSYYFFIIALSNLSSTSLSALLPLADLWSEGGVKPKKECRDHLRCPCGRRWWVLTDRGVASESSYPSRSSLPGRRGRTGWAWWASSPTAPTASESTATSRGRSRTWMTIGTAPPVWLMSSFSPFPSVDTDEWWVLLLWLFF